MAEKIVMPQLGESIAEGTIVKWLKNPGDKVQKDENILLISTDKVEAEIPSPISGALLDIQVQPGQTVAVGTVLGHVGASDEKAQSAKPVETPKGKPEAPAARADKAPMQAAPSAVPATMPAQRASGSSVEATDERFLSPLVKRIAQENQITGHELGMLPGSGRDNRITKDDILKYVDMRQKGPSALANVPVMPSTSQFKPATVNIPAGERELLQPVSTMRRVIMENMVRSRQTSAHVTTFFEVDYTRIDQIRQAHKDRFKSEEGVPLTYTTFLTFAVCQALKRHPYINAEIVGDKIKFKKDVHLGIAVAISEPEPGLMVPVIRGADQMNLRGLARGIADVANRVRTKKIKPDELSGGSFTITNPGNYGAVIGTPIINQPQVAILGVGNIKKQPVVLEMNGSDVIGIRNMGWLSLSFDHRLIDGATADIFMADLKQTLENWSTLP